METIVEQAVVAGIRASDLRDLIVSMPPLAERRGITATLGALDDKIESNRTVHTTIWSLLSAEFDRNSIGGPLVQLRSLLRLEYGKSLPAPSRIPGAVPVLGSNGVTGSHNAALIDGPGVIVGRKGSIGEVHWSHAASFPIDITFFALPVDGYPLLACYFALLKARLKQMNSDSAIPGLNRESALSTYVEAPALTNARDWSEDRWSFLEQLVHLERENVILVRLRDALLPELLSGRIRVPEAREAVPAGAG